MPFCLHFKTRAHFAERDRPSQFSTSKVECLQLLFRLKMEQTCKFSLGSYDENLYQRLTNLHANKYGHDFTLCVGDEKITAHKYALVTKSGFFEKKLPRAAKIKQLEGLNPEHVKKFVEIIETGYTEVPSEEKEEFLDGLAYLEIFGISEIPQIGHEVDIKPELPGLEEEEEEELGLSKIEGSNQVICLRCQKKFSTMNKASRHYKEIHQWNGIQQFKCKMCPKMFKNKRYMGEHMRKMHKVTLRQLKGNIIPETKAKKRKIKDEPTYNDEE